MPRRIIKKLAPSEDTLRRQWFLRPFHRKLADSRLWSTSRRSITAAFGIGLGIAFLPLPVHTLAAVVIAISRRVNVPVAVLSTLVCNPFTVVPLYYLAYRVGSLLLHDPLQQFQFELSWDWLQHGLGPMWKPFLLGCLVSGVTAGVLGRMGLEMIWRWNVRQRQKYRRRRAASSNA